MAIRKIKSRSIDSGAVATSIGDAPVNNATNLQSTNWSIVEVNTVLYFKYGGVTKFKIDSSGDLTVVGNATAYGAV